MYKILFRFILPLVFSIIVILLDINLVKYIINLVPTNANDLAGLTKWAGLIKVAIVFIDIWLTAGLIIVICFLIFGIMNAIADHLLY